LQKGSDVPLLLTAGKFFASLTRTRRRPLEGLFLLAFPPSGGTNFSPTINSPLGLSSSKGSDYKKKLIID
jgi:hypothetical protein